MTTIVELADRVFEVTVTPDNAEWCKRTLSVCQLSGPELTVSDAKRISRAIVRTLRESGAIVHRTRLKRKREE